MLISTFYLLFYYCGISHLLICIYWYIIASQSVSKFVLGWAYFYFIYFLFIKKFFYLLFNWRIIDLQYCAGFCHTPTSISHRYTHAASHLNLPLTSHSIAFSVVFCSIFTYLWFFRFFPVINFCLVSHHWSQERHLIDF